MDNSSGSLKENLRALPRGAWVLFIGSFLNKFGTFVLPFLTLYVTKLGYSTAQSGLAVASYGVGSLCAALLGGHMADRFGRRRTIVFSMFAGGSAMLVLSPARSSR